MANAVAKKTSSEVAQFDASMFEDDAGAGMENMGVDDLALPFLKILSGLDPILDELEEARKGDLFNTVTNQIYKGKEGVRVIPCAYMRRFIVWAPRGSGSGAPQAIYAPGDLNIPKTERSGEDFKDYVVGGNGEYLDETHQHFVLLLSDDGSIETALIAMKSTQLKRSRKWNSMISSITLQGKNGPFSPPRFSHIYRLKSVGEENAKGSWHGWDVSREGPVEDAALYLRAKTFSESVLQGEVLVKHENESGGTTTVDMDDEVPF
tara:strand:- start:594 stop:1385 length:792 start_codon:yes stop_codon:yes gene_type:complete